MVTLRVIIIIRGVRVELHTRHPLGNRIELNNDESMINSVDERLHCKKATYQLDKRFIVSSLLFHTLKNLCVS